MEQHTTTSTRIACIVSLCAGVLAAIYSFATKNPATAIVLGIIAAVIGVIALLMARKNTDDMQLATAGIFMSVVSCIVSLWQMYN